MIFLSSVLCNYINVKDYQTNKHFKIIQIKHINVCFCVLSLFLCLPPRSCALLFVCDDLVCEDSEWKGFVAVEEDSAVVKVELWHDESLVR